MKNVFVDTNVLLSEYFKFDDYDEVYISIVSIEELDNLKYCNDIGYKARQAIKKIENAKNKKIIFDSTYAGIKFIPNKNDNTILAQAYEQYKLNDQLIFLSDDLSLKIKAESIGLPCERFVYKKDEDTYTGYRYIDLDDVELANWYESEVKVNKWGLQINEYAIFRINNEVVDTWVWTSNGFRHLSTKKIESQALGKFKPLDEIQICAIDALTNNQMVMLRGKAGSGKSLISLNYAMSMIEKGKTDKLIIFANPVATRNSAKLGYLPGSKDEKLLDSQVGNMLSSKFGNRVAIESLIKQEKIILLPFSDIRGYDTSGSKSIVYIVEAQNLDIDLMKLAIQRVGEDCQLIIDGDNHTQVDLVAFDGSNNGMNRVSEVFRGRDFYSEIYFSKIYRSKLAEVADLM